VTFSSAGRLWLGYVFVTLSKWITGPSHVFGKMRGHGPGEPADRCYLAFPGSRPVWHRTV